MDPKTALDQHVLRKLEDSFGKAMTMMIMASATTKADCSVLQPDREGYLKLVDAICSDARVMDMWGKSGTDVALSLWKTLV